MTSQELYKKMAELSAAGQPFVLATVVEAFGSTPRKAGAKMIVLQDGSTIDTVGGGKVEQQVVADALEALDRGISRTVKYELRTTGEHALGMECGGETTVFLEVNVPERTLVIAGAGHIAQKLAPMAKLLDFRVVVVDTRPEFATPEAIPAADEVICDHPGRMPELVDLTAGTYVVIVTHGHLHDKDALQAVIDSDAAYIGMIGSRNKVRFVLSTMLEEGVAPEKLARVYSPIGLDLGGNKPAEIAVSIMGEIIALQHDKLDALRSFSNPLVAQAAEGGAPLTEMREAGMAAQAAGAADHAGCGDCGGDQA